MPVSTVGRAMLAAAVSTVLFASPNAFGRGAYDGAWSVTVSGRSGTCDGLSFQYDLQVINGVVRYSGGDANISGSVSSSGDLSVRVSSGDSTAAGSGHLNGRSGHGGFRGRSSSGTCSGSWSATRTGG